MCTLAATNDYCVLTAFTEENYTLGLSKNLSL